MSNLKYNSIVYLMYEKSEENKNDNPLFIKYQMTVPPVSLKDLLLNT